MRYVAVTEGDKTEAELRFGVQVNTWGVNELVDAVIAALPTPTSTRSSPSTSTRYDVVPELRPDGARHESLRDGAAIEARAALVPRGGRLRRLHHHRSKTSAR